jgi:predicted nucleic acid-binding protein
MTTFLDTCIVIALTNDADRLHAWSVEEVIKCKSNGPAVICDIVYCEASIGMATRQEIDDVINEWGIERIHMPDDALFRAGRAFIQYKHINKGPKSGVLPDFLVGATAEVHSAPLMTDDVTRFTTYFPSVGLISPPKVSLPAALGPLSVDST